MSLNLGIIKYNKLAIFWVHYYFNNVQIALELGSFDIYTYYMYYMGKGGDKKDGNWS